MVMYGHAGSAPKGEDLVCAAASMLAWCLRSTVSRMEELLRCPPKLVLHRGRAEIIATPRPEYRAEILMAFWTVQNGIAELAQGFPENVKLRQVLKVHPEDWKGEKE